MPVIPDSFMLYAKFGVDFFSISEFWDPIMKCRLQLVGPTPNFYMISDNSNVSLGIIDCSIYIRRIPVKSIITRKKWTCLHIILSNSIKCRL